MKQLPLSKGKVSLVDDNVYEWASQFKWYFNDNYAVRTFIGTDGKRRNMRLHHAIVGFPLNGLEVDHRNGNKLDNRRSNLRIVPHRINQQNHKRHRKGCLPGVVFQNDKKRNYPYHARILVGTKRISLGYFATEQEAHEKYVEALNNFKLN